MSTILLVSIKWWFTIRRFLRVFFCQGTHSKIYSPPAGRPALFNKLIVPDLLMDGLNRALKQAAKVSFLS